VWSAGPVHRWPASRTAPWGGRRRPRHPSRSRWSTARTLTGPSRPPDPHRPSGTGRPGPATARPAGNGVLSPLTPAMRSLIAALLSLAGSCRTEIPPSAL
jgi:hypothetical protein